MKKNNVSRALNTILVFILFMHRPQNHLTIHISFLKKKNGVSKSQTEYLKVQEQVCNEVTSWETSIYHIVLSM